MFDFDSGKLLIIGVVALVVIGPKDLPRVLRQIGQMMGRVRRMAGEFQGQFMEAIKEADLQDLRTEVAKIKDTARLDVDFDPARDVKHQMLTAVDGIGAEPALAGSSDLMQPLPSVPRASKSFPIIDVDNSPHAAGTVAVAELPSPLHDPLVADAARPAAEEEAGPQGPRRKIVLSRRRVASRFDGPRERALVPHRSRNILPARRETPES